MKISYENSDGRLLKLWDGKIRGVELSGIMPCSNISVKENILGGGSSYVSEHIGCRTVLLKVMLVGNCENAREELRQAFKLNEIGTLYIDSGEAARKIFCRVKDIEFIIKAENYTAEITLICPNPFFQALESTNAVLCGIEALIEFDDWEFTEGEDTELSNNSGSNSAYIINDGDVEAGCVITITAERSVSGIKLVKAETKEYIAFNIDIPAGTQLIIDTQRGQKAVKLFYPSGNFYFDYTNMIIWGSEFFQLSPGSNRIYVEAGNGIDGLTVSAAYTSLYNGV